MIPLVAVAGLALCLEAPAADASVATASPSSVAAPDDRRVDDDAPIVHPDLGTIRYHDPRRRRELWLGLEGGGVALPGSVTGLGRRVWTAHVTPSWALAVTRRLTVGGRHDVTWYDAGNVRLRVHAHALEISGSTMKYRPRLRDRPAVGVEVHDAKLATVEGVDFKLGGIRDVVLHFGYGMEHDLAPWVKLGWRAHLRQVWVFEDTQRQIRVSARLALQPWKQHRFALDLVGFYVNRDPHQAGEPAPRNSVNAQVLGEYSWISRRGIGLVAGARYASSFLAGEAPIYEIRTESLRAHYGEVFAGLRIVWG